jgi:hypothetical protein
MHRDCSPKVRLEVALPHWLRDSWYLVRPIRPFRSSNVFPSLRQEVRPFDTAVPPCDCFFNDNVQLAHTYLLTLYFSFPLTISQNLVLPVNIEYRFSRTLWGAKRPSSGVDGVRRGVIDPAVRFRLLPKKQFVDVDKLFERFSKSPRFASVYYLPI